MIRVTLNEQNPIKVVIGGADAKQDIAVFIEGKPKALETVVSYAVGDRAYALVPATATYVFSIRRNGTEVGTITFAPGETSGVIAWANRELVNGDVLSIVGQEEIDATLSDISITLVTGTA